MNLFCEKCGRTMDEKQFYATPRLDKYPTGRFNQCKKCLTMHVNNWEPETFLWILEDADVPYIEHMWQSMLHKYCQDPKKVTGLTIIGRYLSQMKLSQHKGKTWADTEEINAQYRAATEMALEENTKLTKEEKEEILKGGLEKAPEGYMTDSEREQQALLDSKNGNSGNDSAPQGDLFGYDETDQMFLADLTDDDVKYLSIKWGKYRPSEWVRLEQLYTDMMNSYDIQAAGHKDILKLACKASLKANQLLDIGDIDGALKASRMYDAMMKSGKFTAAQNKAESGEAIDSIAEFALLCEKEEGFIPIFYEGKPNDCVDQTLEDLKKYTHTLVTKEQGLGDYIEASLKAMREDSEKEDVANSDEVNYEDLFEEVIHDANSYESYEEFEEMIDEQRLQDEEGS